MRAARSVGYVGAGTIEMLFDAAARSFYFLEMNTRLQVEHPITELVTGVDLVRWQIAVAQGERLPLAQEAIPRRGAAIECRVYAEDPVKFLPSPGTITSLRVPAGPGVRDDSGVTAGSVISVHYDPMISKLAVWADTRAAAIERMRRALGEYHVGGIRTNLPFHRQVMRHPAFIAGDYDTGFIERHKAELAPAAADDETATLAAVAAAAHAAAERRRDSDAPSICRGRSRRRGGATARIDRSGCSRYQARAVEDAAAGRVRDRLRRLGFDLPGDPHRGRALAAAAGSRRCASRSRAAGCTRCCGCAARPRPAGAPGSRRRWWAG